mgnify:CR=1 FL=1
MNINNTQTFQDIDDLTEVIEKDVNTASSQLVVFNDDFNTFDWVIQSFMEVCNHTFEQSEQLAILIHYSGKARVKTGSLTALEPMKDALVERGISAVIETFATDK